MALSRVLCVGSILAVFAFPVVALPPTLPMNDDNFLRLPIVGDHSLRLLSSNVIEVMMVTAKDPDPAPLTSWNFLDASGNGTLPAAGSFTVSANGSTIPVTGLGFKRRVLYAPLRVRDLRIANWLYLQLGSAIPADAVVNVQNPGNTLWSSSVIFSATNTAQRYSPAIHVNQAGYVANFAKQALVGQYLGTLGEMPIPSGAGFQLVNAANGATVFTGSLTRRPDVGYSYSPTPYQQVFEADFTSFNTPGDYKLFVPGLGVSFSFFIDEGMAATYARTYALGIYHQRCGTDNSMPYTRHTHGPCHTNLVMIPATAGPEQTFVNYVLNNESAGAASNPRHTAPRMTNVTASLYPFVNTAPFDARGGHHDAGDYSKYTTSVSAFVHYLCFAVDSLPGVKDLDNLGLPESGDGVSDVLQEAKWEADYLAKLQDADGGFYFIVYPRTRQYELDSLPDQADLQLVLPKNTSATAAAVAALADMASSPTFKATYPAAASNYLAKAIKGWQFLQTAIARYGSDGAYQMVTFSSDVFMHDDELAWAAAALFTATGDPAYEAFLRTKMPNPNSQSLRRWAWWSMFGGYGCATRDYAFAVRSGRLAANKIDPAYLALCEAEIKFAGSNAVDWSAKMAYGSSFTDESKGLRVAGWYFSGEWTLDPAAAWGVDSSATTKALYLDTILKNYNYEMGCNPVNVTYLTGLGTKRQREIVHQYALNDRRVLPPAGIPLGNIQAQYDYLQLYKTELSALSYPLDDSPGQPYAYYDRWADTFNVSTEFVVSQTAKTLPAAAMLMAMTSTRTQAWNSATARIINLPASSNSTQPVTPSLTSSVDLSKARILWESGNNILRQEPYLGPSYTFTPGIAGPQWVEAEAQLSDGRRLVVATNFTAVMPVTNTIEQYQTLPLANNTNVVAWYKFDGSYADATAHEANLTPAGNVSLDAGSFTWANRPNGAALRVNDLGDKVMVALPNSHLSGGAGTSALSIEAMFYVNRQMAYGRGNANLFVLSKTWNAELALRHNIWTAGPALSGGATSIADNVKLAGYLKTGQWQHFKVRLDGAGYTLSIDGQTVATLASADFSNWGGSGNAAFEIGNFDGWVDEIVVKNEGGLVVVSNPPPATGSAAVSISAMANAFEATLAPGAFRISRDSVAATNLTVSFTVGGTATSGLDYTVLPNSVTIPAGSTAMTLIVTPLQDTNFEGNETVTVTLAANAGYSLGTASASVTIVDDDPDSRPPPPGQTNYVTAATTLNTNVVALYHFDGNLADASGRYANLTPGGLAALNGANLNWMASPSGSALRLLEVGDNATVTLNNVDLYKPGVTASVGVEALVFVNQFTAYTQKPATLFKLAKRWDAQLIYNQDTWQTSPGLWGGVAKVIEVAVLAPYLKTNCWQKVGVFLDETGYFVKINDVEVARSASADLTKWTGAGNVEVEVGSFNGWVDELAVRSNVKGYVPPATSTNQTLTFAALPARAFGDTAFALSATASSGLPVSFSSGNPSVATIAGNTVTIVGAGSAVITASQAGNSNYPAAANVTQMLTVNQATATVILNGLNATYDGAAKSATATTSPSGLPVTMTYNGSVTAPVNVGSYAVVATVNHANYTGSASGTLTIADPGALVTLTILQLGQGTVTPALSGQSFAPGTSLMLTAQPNAGWAFSGWTVEGVAVSTNPALALTLNSSSTVTAGFADAALPVVTITSVSTNLGRATAPSVALSGTATDNAGVQSVEYALVNGGVASGFQLANGTTNWTIDLPAPAYGTNLIRVRARDFQGNLSPEASRTFVYVVLSPFTLSLVGSGSVTPNLNGQLLQLGRTYTLTAKANAGNVFDRWESTSTASNRVLNFVMREGLSFQAYFRETNRPLVTIVSPVSAMLQTPASAINFIGKASDASGLNRVEYALNGGDFQPANGSTNWYAHVNFQAGTNVFRVRSVDQAGNVSAAATRTVFYSVTSPLSLGIAGPGKVSGATNGQRLEIGRAYKLTATPGAGQMFAGWSRGSESPSNALTFLMQTNLALQANFVTNPFAPLKGTYQALFTEADQVRHDRSGSVKLTVSSIGAYSASVKLGAKTVALTGQFNWRGQARLKVPLAVGNVVTLDLQLDVTNAAEPFTGVVTGTNWVGELSGYRTPVYSVANPPLASGRFTFVIPADDRTTNNPAGLGYGTMTVDAKGLGTLSGKLGDGTAISVAASFSRSGSFPLYAQLYSGAGSALSWVQFGHQPLSDFEGVLNWSKPRNIGSVTYPAGFAVESYCVGSAYTATNTPLLNLTQDGLEFSGGALGAGFTNNVTLQAAGTLANLSPNKLTFTLTKSTGQFSGTVVNPLTGVSLTYGGVLFQKWNAALGQALAAKQTSAVRLDAAD